jgi:rare lipoprotein A (peptidoglycan hydrolase)
MHTVSKGAPPRSGGPGRVAVFALLVTTLCVLLCDSSPTLAARRHHRRAHRSSRRSARTTRTPVSIGSVLTGRATWYGPGFHGRRTASGERFSRYAFTLASRGLPMQTIVRVTNLKNGRAAVGRVNDRGPYSHGAIVDLSEALARRVGMGGTSRVKIQVLGWKGKY